jgi:hypothetical protein
MSQVSGGSGPLTYCIERLEIPEYPPLPRQARIQGIQTVAVHLSEQASVQDVSSNFRATNGLAYTYFSASAEKAMRNSHFSDICRGKTITLIFHYEVDDVGGTVSSFAFGFPNHFWVRIGPMPVMPSAATNK